MTQKTKNFKQGDLFAALFEEPEAEDTSLLSHDYQEQLDNSGSFGNPPTGNSKHARTIGNAVFTCDPCG